jgi:hypothetical protein
MSLTFYYPGTFHQYHTAILLLSELYATPERHFEDRIWDCLDYVFDLPSSMARRERAQLIFQEIVSKTEYYHSLRRLRAPKIVEDGIAAHEAETQAASPPSNNSNCNNSHNINHNNSNGNGDNNESPPDARASGSIRGDRNPRYPDPIPSLEFKNFTFIPEVQYYAAAAAGRPSQSPQGSESSVAVPAANDLNKKFNLYSNNCNTIKVDIDWVSANLVESYADGTNTEMHRTNGTNCFLQRSTLGK